MVFFYCKTWSEYLQSVAFIYVKLLILKDAVAPNTVINIINNPHPNLIVILIPLIISDGHYYKQKVLSYEYLISM